MRRRRARAGGRLVCKGLGATRVFGAALIVAALTGCVARGATMTGQPGEREHLHPITDIFGPLVGTICAQVEWRRGFLSEQPGLTEIVHRSLRPLDIMVVKNGHRLTDDFIPGFFTHSLIWLGSEQRLRDAGLWDDPRLAAFREPIRSGRSVVEVDHAGVHLVALEEVWNTDRIVVLRIVANDEAQHERMAGIYQRVAARLGEPYDFSFDVDTPSRTTCTEFAARVFADVSWPIRDAFDRRVLVPDDMIRAAAAPGRPIAVVTYVKATDPATGYEANMVELSDDLANVD